ncbi:MAG: glycosyltransferase family 2 protein, partial [Ilumatobacteraceae bacterium]
MSDRSVETLTIFFPMWNEEAYIERTIAAGREIGDELVEAGTISNYELIIVDDASTDATPAMADALAAADPRVKVVHHPVNRKLGGSIKTGFA